MRVLAPASTVRDCDSSGPAANYSRGFTLIEILVVMLIIGILATAISFSIDSRSLDNHLLEEAQRLQQLLRLAGEDAEAKGVQIGFRYTQQGYEFLAVGEDGQWAVIEDGGLLRARELGPPFEIELKVEGRAVAPAIAQDADPDRPIEPQILLLSSGELTPFSLWLKAGGAPESGQLLQGTLTGTIELQPWSRDAWAERARS